jgi:hypothetical protein
MSKENSSVVTNKSSNPTRKKISAIFSSLPAFFIVPLIDKNERIQLVINKNIAAVVNSSMIVLPEIFNSLSDVSTTKQSPRRLEDAFKMWGDLSLSCIYLLSFQVSNTNTVVSYFIAP